tara:strand:- start:31 stop:144 length:114 start_codon:yes stop_codon:yes gene_type:complete
VTTLLKEVAGMASAPSAHLVKRPPDRPMEAPNLVVDY